MVRIGIVSLQGQRTCRQIGVHRASAASPVESKHPSSNERWVFGASPTHSGSAAFRCWREALKGLLPCCCHSLSNGLGLHGLLLLVIHFLDFRDGRRILRSLVVPPSAREPGEPDRETRAPPQPALPPP